MEKLEKTLSTAELENDPVRVSFEKQFNHPKEVKLENGEELVIYDLIPESPRPESILFAPGIIQNPKNHKESSYAWYKDGRRVVFPDSPHGVDVEKISGLPEAELRKAASLLAALDIEKVARTDAIGHSEGAINLVIAAALEPKKFKNIVLVEPAGLAGKRNPIAMALGILRDENRVGKEEFHMVGDRNNYYLKTFPKTLPEALAAMRTTINDILVYLKQNGVHISVIHAVEDKLFPMEEVQKMADLNQIDGFYSVKGGHQRMFTEPSLYAKLAEEALNSLDKSFPDDENRENS